MKGFEALKERIRRDEDLAKVLLESLDVSRCYYDESEGRYMEDPHCIARDIMERVYDGGSPRYFWSLAAGALDKGALDAYIDIAQGYDSARLDPMGVKYTVIMMLLQAIHDHNKQWIHECSQVRIPPRELAEYASKIASLPVLDVMVEPPYHPDNTAILHVKSDLIRAIITGDYMDVLCPPDPDFDAIYG